MTNRRLLVSTLAGIALVCLVTQVAGLFSRLQAQTAAATLYSIEINGTPVSGNAPLNLVAAPGILFSVPATVNGVTEVNVTPDASVLLSRVTDIAGDDHVLLATSSPSGITYSASTSPPIAGYSTGQWFVLIPDVATQPGATLNLQGLGPVSIEGTCSQICILLAVGPTAQPSGPVAAFAVH